jgi:hypothetical protein
MNDVSNVDERAEQGAYNQALFRQVNERIRAILSDPSVSHEFGAVASDPDWVCECANVGCMQRIAISDHEYALIRSESARFLVVAEDAHVFLDIEDVVERRDTYWIVEKTGDARVVAEELAREG